MVEKFSHTKLSPMEGYIMSPSPLIPSSGSSRIFWISYINRIRCILHAVDPARDLNHPTIKYRALSYLGVIKFAVEVYGQGTRTEGCTF